jgi:hypothetical protein
MPVRAEVDCGDDTVTRVVIRLRGRPYADPRH